MTQLRKIDDFSGSRPLNPASIHVPFGNYSHAVLVRNTELVLFASGQLGMSRDGDIPSDVVAQTRICFDSADAILADAGLDRSAVVRIAGFVTSRAYMRDYMRVRDRWIAELACPPTSTLVIVSGFTRPEFKVEIEVTAVKVCSGR